MHTDYCYARFHKIHHTYKSPFPFGDLYIHPIEAFGYYLILFSPPCLFQMHVYPFMIYMSLMGLCGVLDHSGINFDFYIYNSEFHGIHHQTFQWNYAFPLPIMDHIFGTYYNKD